MAQKQKELGFLDKLNSGTPVMYTGGDLFDQGVAEVLDYLVPGMGPLGARFVSPWLQKQTGLYGDPLMSSVMMTNMSPYGVSQQLQQNIAQTTARSVTDSMSLDAKRTFFRGLAKTMTSKQAWENMSGQYRGSDYESYIDNQVKNYMDNKAIGAVYAMADPMEMGMVNQYSAIATTNMIRHGLSAGDRDAFVRSKEIMKRLYQDDNGNYSFNKADYGNMGQGEVAAVAAALTKTMDFAKGIDVNNAETLKQASNKFKDTVKKYADALSPLKDVFGQDVPSMIKAIEQMSGQSLATMGAARAKSLATMVQDHTSSGYYGQTQVATVSQGFTQAMDNMNIPSINKQNTTMYAVRALDAGQGPYRPSNMTSRDFTNKTAETILKTANSIGSDEMAMAYSIWSQRNPGKSQEDFRAEMAKLKEGGMDSLGAALALANVQNRYELGIGKSYEGYGQAVTSGLSADLAFEANFDRTSRVTRERMSRDVNIQKALENRFGSSYQDQDLIGNAYDRMMKAAGANVEIFNMTGNERLLAIANSLRGEGEPEIRSMEQYNAMDADLRKQIEEVDTLVTTMKQNDDYQPMYLRVFANANMKKQAMVAKKAQERRAIVDSLGSSTPSGVRSFINDYILNNGKGMSEESLKEMLSKETFKKLGVSEEAVRETTAVMEAAKVLGSSLGLKEDQIEDMKIDMGQYVNGAEGLNNKLFRNALKNYTTASYARAKMTEGSDEYKKQTEVMQRQAARMQIYRYANPEAIEDYLKDNKDGEEKLIAMVQNKDQGVEYARQYIENQAIKKRIDTLTQDKNVRAIHAEYNQALGLKDGENWWDTGKRLSPADFKKFIEEGKKKAEDAGDTEKQKAYDDVLSKWNEGAQGQVPMQQMLQDVLGLVKTALDGVNKTMTAQDTKLANGPNQEEPKAAENANRPPSKGTK